MEPTEITPETPAMSPPPGHIPNFINPTDTLRTIELSTNTVALALPTILVILRIVTKVKVVKKWYWEDFFSILATFYLVTWTAIGLHEPFTINVTRHQYDVRLIDMSDTIYWANVLEILYCPTMLFAKLSVILQIKRIFVTTKRDAFFYCTWATLIMTTVFYLTAMLLFIFQCNPRQKAWNPTLPGHCMNAVSLLLSIACVNAASDWLTLALPIWATLRLNMQRKRKIEVAAIFGVGLFACVLGSVGIIYRVRLYDAVDFTYGIAKVGIYSIAEVSMVICVGCIPAIPRLFQYIMGRDPSSARNRTPGYNERSAASSKKSPFAPLSQRSERSNKNNPLRSMAKYLGANDDTLVNDTIHVEETFTVEGEKFGINGGKAANVSTEEIALSPYTPLGSHNSPPRSQSALGGRDQWASTEDAAELGYSAKVTSKMEGRRFDS